MASLITSATSEFASALPNGGKLLGLDVGTKTIGIAICDAGWHFAGPSETIRRTKFTQDLASLRRIIDHEHALGLVVGLPLNMDGSEGPASRGARKFAERLAEGLGVTVEMFDERLTSFEARERLANMPARKGMRKTGLDALAAVVILEGWMHAHPEKIPRAGC